MFMKITQHISAISIFIFNIIKTLIYFIILLHAIIYINGLKGFFFINFFFYFFTCREQNSIVSILRKFLLNPNRYSLNATIYSPRASSIESMSVVKNGGRGETGRYEIVTQVLLLRSTSSKWYSFEIKFLIRRNAPLPPPPPMYRCGCSSVENSNSRRALFFAFFNPSLNLASFTR